MTILACSQNRSGSQPDDPAQMKSAFGADTLLAHTWCAVDEVSNYSVSRLARYTFSKDETFRRDLVFKFGDQVQIYELDSPSKWHLANQPIIGKELVLKIEPLVKTEDWWQMAQAFQDFDTEGQPKAQLKVLLFDNIASLRLFPCPSSLKNRVASTNKFEAAIRSQIEVGDTAKIRLVTPVGITWPLLETTQHDYEVSHSQWCRITRRGYDGLSLEVRQFDGHQMKRRNLSVRVDRSLGVVRNVVSASDDNGPWYRREGNRLLSSKDTLIKTFRSGDGTIFMTTGANAESISSYDVYILCEDYKLANGNYRFDDLEWTPVSLADPFALTNSY